MPRFRAPTFGIISAAPSAPLAVGLLTDAVMQPDNFFAAPELCLTWIAGRSETIPWEMFHGRLLDASQTRRQRTFLSWHVKQDDAEPMLSVKLDVHERQIHVTRGLLSYIWEAHGAGVIESREVVKWTRELVGTITLDEYAGLDELRDELICLIWQAIVGTSRLPLTSVEAPLPAFTFGQLHYFYCADVGDKNPIASWKKLLTIGFETGCGEAEMSKLVEFVLRLLTPKELPLFAKTLLSGQAPRWTSGALTALWRQMFNGVSLSPYTSFVDRALACFDLLAARGEITGDDRIGFLSHLLRQLNRHLTAYDLVTFHHRGANYPDALLLDAVLKRYLHSTEASPDRFLGNEPQAQRHRRALRQACLMRRHYEGHLVPDLPTSPGENARVLPASRPRVPEEQLLQTPKRRRQLFVNDPLAGLLTETARRILAQSIADLEHLDERVEMGLGAFIDRPLGYAKQVGEPDLTPLLAHEAFSPSLARRRWGELKKLCAELAIPFDANKLDALFESGAWPAGLPHAEVAECPRPTAALCDVRKVAGDFVILRTKPVGLSQMLGHFDLVRNLRQRHRLAFLDEAHAPHLCVQTFVEEQPMLVLFDGKMRRRVAIRVDTSQGYRTRAGVELPRAGLRVCVVWEDTDDLGALLRREVDELYPPR